MNVLLPSSGSKNKSIKQPVKRKQQAACLAYYPFVSEDAGSTLIRNVDGLLPLYTE
jgi:hypothetical protein